MIYFIFITEYDNNDIGYDYNDRLLWLYFLYAF